ncbi:tripartite tricarboxylate transporter substrate binding protein [Hydrogenophaga sp.]|uniref:Bug family tripartite tricarboxylate transporter substrate binding protein n=1 Tax=Hydrogenophaga sp. TaxID=1904254 RepID=UPI002637831D|nr:tripartite tricarboxylate transporter substrate binding protein [Hydrogenophaga sp.]MCW5655133.1 tripartite tricarboxylate transporter substrate binding protein [Hydrogenophaga sp.]
MTTRTSLLRRRCLLSLAAAMAALAGPALAADAAYPQRPVKFIAPVLAGGGTDLFARRLAEHVGPLLGGSVIVENIAGAGGNIGTQAVVRAPADGYTVAVGTTGTLVVNLLTAAPGVPTPSFRDLVPVAIVGTQSLALVVNNDVPARNVAELVRYLQTDSREHSYGTVGTGGFIRLTTELFMEKAGNIRMTPVPYRGGAAALTDLMGGHIQVYFDAISGSLANHRAGKVRMLGVTGRQRSPAVPDLPTIAEAGVPGFNAETAYLIAVPQNTPEPVVSRLRSAVMKALQDPAYVAALRELAIEPAPLAAQTDARAYLEGEYLKWKPIAERLDIHR